MSSVWAYVLYMKPTRLALPGDVVFMDWASGSPTGERHVGFVQKTSPNGTLAKVDWTPRAGLAMPSAWVETSALSVTRY